MAAAVSIVVIDDHPEILALLHAALISDGVRIFTTTDPEEGLDIIFREHPRIVITDLVMPGGVSGLDVVDRVVAFDSAIEVIVMTGHSAAESAVEAIRKGASDYLTKPVKISVLRERISKLVDEARRRDRGGDLEDQLLEAANFEGMIGRSAALFEMSSRILRVAPHYRTALVTGETGTGKELAAKALHNLSPVSKGRFVVLNCSAVVETLFESELFGHVRGSFTGAEHDKMGLFEYADKGTIFLDEIGDMPAGTQAKLLRTLQNQEVLRVGSLTPRRIDVRVIAATHRDLRRAIAEKQFREDLYYRLSMIEVKVPSLAERKEDLPLLTRHFVWKFSALFRKQILGLTQRAQIVVARHNWPGNIRELENAIGHACMMVVGDTIDVQDLPEYLRTRGASSPTPIDSLDRTSLEAHEKRVIADALARSDGNQSEAARSLRIARETLRIKIEKYGLDPSPGKAASA
jgi:DNA-binding NtrC family response regulator